MWKRGVRGGRRMEEFEEGYTGVEVREIRVDWGRRGWKF